MHYENNFKTLLQSSKIHVGCTSLVQLKNEKNEKIKKSKKEKS